MNYLERMKQDLAKIEEFNNDIVEQVEVLKITLKTASIFQSVKDDDSKTVKAHKNQTVKKVERIIKSALNKLDNIFNETDTAEEEENEA